MVTEKPIVARWRSSAIALPLRFTALASLMSIIMIAMTIAAWFEDQSHMSTIIVFIMLAIILGTIWSLVIFSLRKENPYKTSIKIIDATPGLEHKLVFVQHAHYFVNAFGTEVLDLHYLSEIIVGALDKIKSFG